MTCSFGYGRMLAQLRLFDPATDRTPCYAPDAANDLRDDVDEEETDAAQIPDGRTFALENHLRDFLAKDVTLIEPGTTLFAEIEGIDGAE